MKLKSILGLIILTALLSSIAPRTKAADYNRDGFADLFAVARANGGTQTQAHILNGANNFASFVLQVNTVLHTTDANWDFSAGDYNRDGITDLYAIARSGGSSTLVHVLNGADNFQSFLLHAGTALHTTDAGWEFDLGDYNRDGILDLYAIARNGGTRTLVHVLNGANNFAGFLLHATTALHNTDAGWVFDVGDYNRDGHMDLYAIARTASTSTQVHVLNGADNFASFLLHANSGLHPTNSGWEFALADYNRDGILDLYAVAKAGSNGKTDVHVLNGSGNFASFLLHASSALHTTNSGWDFLTDPTKATSGSYALPLRGLPRTEYDDPHHTYPAIDLQVPIGTPVYVVRGGTASRIITDRCGNGYKITGTDGAVYYYCHLNAHVAANGGVSTNQLLGYSGKTGNTTGPHLHLELLVNGVQKCPQNLLLAVYDGRTPPSPSSLPSTGCVG